MVIKSECWVEADVLVLLGQFCVANRVPRASGCDSLNKFSKGQVNEGLSAMRENMNGMEGGVSVAPLRASSDILDFDDGRISADIASPPLVRLSRHGHASTESTTTA